MEDLDRLGIIGIWELGLGLEIILSQVIEFLLSHPHLEVNKQDYSGATALVYAVDAMDSEAARLSHPGADPTIRTWSGQFSIPGATAVGGWKAGKCG